MKGLKKVTNLVVRLSGARFYGYEDLVSWSGKNRRTIYRWIQAVREEFGDQLEQKTFDNGKKGFRLRTEVPWLDHLAQPTSEDIAALDIAIEALKGRQLPTDALEAFRDRLTRLLERRKELARVETDVEAQLDGFGLSFRPGPRVRVPKEIRATVHHAIIALNKLRFRYRAPGRPVTEHTVIPYGVLIGSAPHLVGAPEGPRGPDPRPFRMDRISDIEEIAEEGYQGPPEDGFRNYRKTLFDSYSEEPLDVEWRFHPQAPQVDRWRFHPDQTLEIKPDGSVVVCFRAGGKDDMARHLIGWWDWVTGIRPKALRETVFRMRLAGLAPLIEEFSDLETARRIAKLAEEHDANRVRPEDRAAQEPAEEPAADPE